MRVATCIVVMLLSNQCLSSFADQSSNEAIKVDPQAGNLPDSLTDLVFVELVRRLSEPGGEFPSDNFISNESSYLHPIKTLHERRVAGGVYIGVGPEQNFTYIAEIKPGMAFLIDIRRQNMLLHLIYKALFILSDDRAEFLSKLLSKPLYTDLSFLDKLFHKEPVRSWSDIEPSVIDLVRYFDEIESDKGLFKQNLLEIKSRLRTYGIDSTEDMKTVEYIYQAFFRRQLDIRYDTPGVGDTYFNFPNLRELLLATTAEGERASFLASDSAFNTVKEMQKKNLIIPVVGDFAGETSLRGISDYVRSHDATISVFYVSNVELYLTISSFYEDRSTFSRYFENVLSMPIDESSLFIRAYANDNFNNMMSHPRRIGDHAFTSVVQSVFRFIEKDESWRSLEGYDRYVRIVTDGILGNDAVPSEAIPLVAPRMMTVTSTLPQEYSHHNDEVEIVVSVRFTSEGVVDTIWTEKPSAYPALDHLALKTFRGFRLKPVMGTEIIVPTNMIFKYKYRLVSSDDRLK